MRLPLNISLSLSILLLTTTAAIADTQTTTLAKNKQNLVTLATKSKRHDNSVNAKREAAFLANKKNQLSQLKSAKKAFTDEQKKSEKLEKTFSDNEKSVAEAHAKLREELGTLKEIFGHLTAAAGDARSQFADSIISAEHPGREIFLDTFIRDMESDTRLPSSQQIENLWQELEREIIASGKISQFENDLITPNGDIVQATITRVGNFNLIANSKYLSFSSDNNTISQLSRQPSSNGAPGIAQLNTLGPAEYVNFSIDPTGPIGGSYLRAMIGTPNIKERWHQGGIIGYVISAFGIIALLLASWRFVDLTIKYQRVRKQLTQWNAGESIDTGKANNPLAHILLVYQSTPDLDAESIEIRLGEAILKQKPSIERYLGAIKIISMITPLLGLLGTVSGMIMTFQAITIFGAGDPKTMAGGISSALVTTVLGLVVAIPTVLAHSALVSRANNITHLLRQQSAGLIALRQESDSNKTKAAA